MDFQTSSSFLKEDARSMSQRKVLKARKRHDPSQEGEKHNGAWEGCEGICFCRVTRRGGAAAPLLGEYPLN